MNDIDCALSENLAMGAAIVGDITPADGVSDEDKHQLEAAAMARIRAMLGSNTAAGQQMHSVSAGPADGLHSVTSALGAVHLC